MSRIAIIGTAGRDKDKPMTLKLWLAMIADCRTRFGEYDELVSGGAAWADHLAVVMFFSGHAADLCLHLPAPIDTARCEFTGPIRSSASAANYYHERFSRIIGANSRAQIVAALGRGAEMTYQPPIHGYSGMFTRNKRVAEDCDSVLAYTWGDGDEPADGGTKNTWDQVKGERTHVPLGGLLA